MTPFSMFLALQPLFRDEWALSNTASGWISSAYFGGYMLAVPMLSSLTDRACDLQLANRRSVCLTAGECQPCSWMGANSSHLGKAFSGIN